MKPIYDPKRCRLHRTGGNELFLDGGVDKEAEMLVELEIEGAEMNVLAAESVGFLGGFVELLEGAAMAVDHLLVVLDEERVVELAVGVI